MKFLNLGNDNYSISFINTQERADALLNFCKGMQIEVVDNIHFANVVLNEVPKAFVCCSFDNVTLKRPSLFCHCVLEKVVVEQVNSKAVHSLINGSKVKGVLLL